MLFDGGGNDDRECALVAEQRGEEIYHGVWTDEPVLVDRALAADALTE